MTLTDVVVTGRGVVSSIGEGADAFFEALLAKRSGIADGIGACVDFDPEVAMTPKEARRADRYTQLAVAAATQAAEEAGLPDGVDPERLGVLVGTGVGGLDDAESECQAWLEGGDRAVSPHFVPMMMPNAAAGTIAMRLGAHGPGFSVSSACATGGHAIGEAARMIARGEADAVVAGGTEAALTGLCIAAFKRMGALSREGISRPFDARARRLRHGRGRGRARARARGARAGSRREDPRRASRATAPPTTPSTSPQPDEDGRGASQAMRAALADAGRLGRATSATSTPTAPRRRSTTDRDARDQAGVQRLVDAAAGVLDEVAHRPPARRRRRGRGDRVHRGGAPRRPAARRSTTRSPTPSATSTTCPRAPREAPGLELALSNSFGFGGQNACLAVARA